MHLIAEPRQIERTSKGSIRVRIPKKIADRYDLEHKDTVFFKDEGDGEITLAPPEK